MAYNVVTLLSDDRLRRRLSQEAVKYATKFSWEKVAKAEAEMYRKVLDFWSSKF
jgi:glycosyltransferase involved in cell wall biosynthesis